jgi:hypothetical protein
MDEPDDGTHADDHRTRGSRIVTISLIVLLVVAIAITIEGVVRIAVLGVELSRIEVVVVGILLALSACAMIWGRARR